ncbi:MAG: phytanoyl-CoA dioxygenase family protein [Abitibacteriaceae bacterium]|nr:phytanoyl-CoA dioxygenase family protein [Abditibacteriaceae bacterium]MBV9864343.1 phytanoyl-CoA dioxygenase family protein [Abditibacteriaceae bacterium]
MKLSDEQVKAFREDGVVVVEHVVTDADLAPVIQEYEAWIDQRARQLQAEGEITELYPNEPFETRFAKLYEQSPRIADGMDIMQMRGPAMFNFLRNDNLLDAVECLVGPEILCNPIQHIRAKPPAKVSGEGAGFYNVPWHQDSGVTWEEADNSEIVTCWMALVDATVENGCMQVLPGVWKQGHLEHQAEGGTTIRPDLLPDVEPRPVPVGKGGVVFMHRHTPHTSTPNYSDGVRWSLDLRYQKAGTPTGRPFHPAFIARSRENPSRVLTDHAEWSRLWVEALENAKNMKAHRVK